VGAGLCAKYGVRMARSQIGTEVALRNKVCVGLMRVPVSQNSFTSVSQFLCA
jgi:hypothetical protein